jgi:nucleotide-binding universal stress UspA family protein
VRLLIAYDGSAAAQAAVAAAGALFAPAAAILLHVREPALRSHPGAAHMHLPDDVVRTGLAELERRAAERARAVAEEGTRRAATAGLEATGQIAVGSRPWRCIEAAALEHGVDVVVTGTHGRAPIGRAFLGSTASSLLHHAPAPVLVVPPGTPPPSYRVVLGFDGSASARRALRFAAEHLASHTVLVTYVWRSPIRHSAGGELLHCLPLDVVRDFITDYDAAWEADARATAEKGMTLAASLGLAADARVVESHATPWHALLETAARERSTLIVTGAERENPVTSALGSVSSGLVHHAATAILVVPPATAGAAAEDASAAAGEVSASPTR